MDSRSYLGALGPRLHDEAEYTVARAAHRKSAQKLVLQRLGLRVNCKKRGRATFKQPANNLGRTAAIHQAHVRFRLYILLCYVQSLTFTLAKLAGVALM